MNQGLCILITGWNNKENPTETNVVNQWPREARNMFVISIRESRLQSFEERLGSLCKYLTIVDGVNGTTLDPNKLIKQHIYKPLNKWNNLTRGELGCFLSHRAVWQQVVQKKIPYALIMEDDCVLYPNTIVLTQLKKVLGELQVGDPNWKILFVSRNAQIAETLKKITPNIVKPGRTWGLFCYIVSLQGATELLAQSTTLRMAADIFVSTTKISGRYACEPMLCTVNKEHSDTVDIK